MTTRMRFVWAVLLPALLVGIAACSPATEEVGPDGVALATVPAVPTQTPLPTLAVDLPQEMSVNLLDLIAVQLNVPAEWQVVRQGGTAVAFGEGPVYTPQIGCKFFYHAAEPEDALWSVNTRARQRMLWEPINAGRLEGDLYAEYFSGGAGFPEYDAYDFTWGEYEAAWAAYTVSHAGAGVTLVKQQVALRIGEEDYLVLWAAVPLQEWAALDDEILAVFGSLVVNGEPLPADEITAVLQDVPQIAPQGAQESEQTS